MTKEVWELFNQWKLDEYLIKIQNVKILDLGCGPGNLLYHLYHQYKSLQYTGVEEKKIDELEKSISLFYDYDSKIDKVDLIDNQNKIPLYKYYSEVARVIIGINEPLSEKEFRIEIRNKINDGICISDFLRKKDNLYSSYHLIVLSKVLHYRNVGPPKEVVNKCFNLLICKGYIAITLKKNGFGSDRIEYSFQDLMDWTKDFTEIEAEDSKDIIYYLGKKE